MMIHITEIFDGIKSASLILQVASIKSGMWDSVYDTFQAISQQELVKTPSDKYSEFESIEVEPSKQVAVLNTEHIVQHTNSE